VSKSALLEVLADLNENRHLSFEIDEAITPFFGKAYTLSLSFVSSSSTLGNRFGPEYNDGFTLICQLEGGLLEANLQMTPDENALVESLAPGTSFEIQVTLLDFDSLYQRAIFGSLPDGALADAGAENAKEADEEEIEPEATVETIEESLDEPEAIEPEEAMDEPTETSVVEAMPDEKEPDDFIEAEAEDDEIFVEEIGAEEEVFETEDEDFREERKKLLGQLSETVDKWRTSTNQETTTEEEEEEHEEEKAYEQIEYEGEEPEWVPVSKPPAATQRQSGLPPMKPEEPKKKGCLGCSGCLKAVVVLMVVLPIIFFVFIMLISDCRDRPREGGEASSAVSTAGRGEDTYRPLAFEALPKLKVAYRKP